MATAVLFCAALLGFCLFTLLLPKETVSVSERRKLERLPEFSAETLFSGAYFTDLTDYVTDHFAAREALRTVNTAVRTTVFLQKDIGGVYLENGCLYEPRTALDARAVEQNAKKLNALAEKYGSGKNVYWSVIPDKADFSESDAPRLDTEAVIGLMSAQLKGTYIDILATLENDDYYRTDTHWRQERLGDTVDALLSGMGRPAGVSAQDFTAREISPFYGVLWGRYAMPLNSETLYYLTNDVTDAATVKNYENAALTTVYTPSLDSPDRYDVFLGGAAALLEIESPLAETDRTLVLFRDSFGSSLAPWLLTRYKKIVIIDTRYIASSAIDSYVDLSGADDLLFLYSTSILNTGGILK